MYASNAFKNAQVEVNPDWATNMNPPTPPSDYTVTPNTGDVNDENGVVDQTLVMTGEAIEKSVGAVVDMMGDTQLVYEDIDDGEGDTPAECEPFPFEDHRQILDWSPQSGLVCHDFMDGVPCESIA